MFTNEETNELARQLARGAQGAMEDQLIEEAKACLHPEPEKYQGKWPLSKGFAARARDGRTVFTDTQEDARAVRREQIRTEALEDDKAGLEAAIRTLRRQKEELELRVSDAEKDVGVTQALLAQADMNADNWQARTEQIAEESQARIAALEEELRQTKARLFVIAEVAGAPA